MAPCRTGYSPVKMDATDGLVQDETEWALEKTTLSLARPSMAGEVSLS